MERRSNRAYLWLDLETTGNDANVDCILEVGWFFTDDKLRQLPEVGHSVCVWPARNDWESLMIPVVYDMHQKSGLLDLINRGMVGETELRLYWEVEKHLLDDIKRIKASGRDEVVLAGSGVSHIDMPFLKRWMSLVPKELAYFMIDIGQVRRFLRDVVQLELTAEEQTEFDTFRQGAHRGLADALAHWQEAQFWARILEERARPLSFFSTEGS